MGGGESGVGTALLCKQQGYDVFLSDEGLLKEHYKYELEANLIAFEEGHHTPALILNADEVMKSPGIPHNNPMVQQLLAKGIPVLSEMVIAYRHKGSSRIIGITGSNGKTTVKEMLAAILVAHTGDTEQVLATQGNLNNDLGMPLTALRLRNQHRFAVLEMGMNHPGEIHYMSDLAKPDVA